MPILTSPNSPAFPSVSPQTPPTTSYHPNSNSSATLDYGFKRYVSLPQSPPVGAGILAITFFFLIVFFSDVLLARITLTTIGIAVTLSTLGLMALVLLILFMF